MHAVGSIRQRTIRQRNRQIGIEILPAADRYMITEHYKRAISPHKEKA